MNSPQHLLEQLRKAPIYQEYEQAFADATGLTLALTDKDSWQFAVVNEVRDRPWCEMMAARRAGCASCPFTQSRCQHGGYIRPKAVACGYGLFEAAVPIKIGPQIVGYLQTGQVHTKDPAASDRKHFEKEIARLGSPEETSALRLAWENAPVMAAGKFESAVRLLEIFAEHLSIVCNQIAVQQKNNEPIAMIRAKEYIRRHHEEDITLKDVARAACTSTFYLCKLFKRTMGMNFTEFVARTRVEEAKKLLLNRNRRVSEVAYEVGFQSLTHFNRVFRNVVGESPTEYRAALPNAA